MGRPDGDRGSLFEINDQCIGCGLCAEIAPETFGMSSDETLPFDAAVVRGRPETADQRDRCREAAHLCPADAIVPLDADPAPPPPGSADLLRRTP